MKTIRSNVFESGNTTPGQQPKKLVLYVEDDPSNRQVAKFRLEKKYELLLAVSDKEACAILSRRHQDISIILLDIELKDSILSGIQIAKMLRGTLAESQKPDYAKSVPKLETPIIFVTAFGSKHPREELLGLGANDVILKPVDFVELEMAMTKVHLARLKK